MKALVTGASSGIGRDIAIYLSSLGHDVIMVSSDIDKLNKAMKYIKGNCKVIKCDLSKEKECIKLYEQTKDENIYILINNSLNESIGGNSIKSNLPLIILFISL